jgi:predicted phosphate transport protein (TIGR00153 family)
MLSKLIPTDKRFFVLFNLMGETLKKGADLLAELVAHPERGTDVAVRLERLESEADELTHELLVLLDKSFVTPIDREDIHELAQALDDILDQMESVTERMQLYRLSEPTQAMRTLVEIIGLQIIEVNALLPQIPGFRYEKVIPHCKEINRLENQGDKALRGALAELFSGEMAPLEVMKWKDIYDFLEAATDKCEDVSGIVERIVLKHG